MHHRIYVSVKCTWTTLISAAIWYQVNKVVSLSNIDKTATQTVQEGMSFHAREPLQQLIYRVLHRGSNTPEIKRMNHCMPFSHSCDSVNDSSSGSQKFPHSYEPKELSVIANVCH
jgi:hypothetical protein